MKIYGINDFPEVKLARRIIEKHSLAVPFDVEKLVSEYAEVVYRRIPIIGVDGISINLKTVGKKTRIVVNTIIPKTRQTFTLAHELGHIIIPWHLGTIIDSTDIFNLSVDEYFMYEQEANRFAAELLMPMKWLQKEILVSGTLSDQHFAIVRKSRVSDHAAAVRLTQISQPNVLYVAVMDGEISHVGKSNNSTVFSQSKNEYFDQNLYQYYSEYSLYEAGSVVYHWFVFKNNIKLKSNEPRNWKEILDDILQEIDVWDDPRKIKQSINGVIGSANTKLLFQGKHSLDDLVAACIHRLRRPGFEAFTSHPDFENFVIKRAMDLYKQ